MVPDFLFTSLLLITPTVILAFWYFGGIGKWQCIVAGLNILGTLWLAYSIELQYDNETAKGMFQPASINKKRLIVGLCFIIGSAIIGLLTPTLLK